MGAALSRDHLTCGAEPHAWRASGAVALPAAHSFELAATSYRICHCRYRRYDMPDFMSGATAPVPIKDRGGTMTHHHHLRERRRRRSDRLDLRRLGH